jgi:hypothetical protein
VVLLLLMLLLLRTQRQARPGGGQGMGPAWKGAPLCCAHQHRRGRWPRPIPPSTKARQQDAERLRLSGPLVSGLPNASFPQARLSLRQASPSGGARGGGGGAARGGRRVLLWAAPLRCSRVASLFIISTVFITGMAYRTAKYN